MIYIFYHIGQGVFLMIYLYFLFSGSGMLHNRVERRWHNER